MALFGNNYLHEKVEADRHKKSEGRSKPVNFKINHDPKARHEKAKCFEDPKNKDLRKQWEDFTEPRATTTTKVRQMVIIMSKKLQDLEN